MVRQLVKDKIKAVHPFPYVDKCLPIADWNDPMWNTEGFNPSISEVVTSYYEKELQKLEAERIIVKPTEQELLWLSSMHSGDTTRARFMMRLTCIRLYSDLIHEGMFKTQSGRRNTIHQMYKAQGP